MTFNEYSVPIVLRRFNSSQMYKSLDFPNVSMWLRNCFLWNASGTYTFVFAWSFHSFWDLESYTLFMKLLKKASIDFLFRIIKVSFSIICFFFSIRTTSS